MPGPQPSSRTVAGGGTTVPSSWTSHRLKLALPRASSPVTRCPISPDGPPNCRAMPLTAPGRFRRARGAGTVLVAATAACGRVAGLGVVIVGWLRGLPAEAEIALEQSVRSDAPDRRDPALRVA